MWWWRTSYSGGQADRQAANGILVGGGGQEAMKRERERERESGRQLDKRGDGERMCVTCDE